MNCYCWFHVIRIIFNFLTFVTRLALRYSEDCWKSIDGIRTIRNKMMKTLKKLIKKIILTWTIDIMELECASNYAGNYTYYYTNQWNQLFSARMCRFLHRWKFMCNIYLMETSWKSKWAFESIVFLAQALLALLESNHFKIPEMQLFCMTDKTP